MAVIEVRERRDELTQRQRYSHYFAIAFGILGLIIGVNLRDSALGATTQYVDTRAGIRAFYPQNWLLESASPDFIFRVQDVSQPGYKTTIEVSVRPVSPQTTVRNVLEALSLNRSQTLSEYNVFSIEPYTLADESQATAMTYAFAAGESDPFLASLPSVVRGLDVLTIRRGQAIIITFLSDSRSYDQNFPVFEQFLEDLEF